MRKVIPTSVDATAPETGVVVAIQVVVAGVDDAVGVLR